METLEEQIQNVEATYLSTVESILKLNCSNRTKAALIYKHFIKMQVSIEDLVSAAKLQPLQSAVSVN